MTDDLTSTRAAIRATGDRLVRLLSRAPEASATAVGDWTIGDLAIHLTDVYEHYPLYLRGEAELFDDPLDVTAHNAAAVAAGQGLTLEEAARRIGAALEEVDDLFGTRRPGEPVPWHGGTEISPSAFGAVIGSEAVVHGYDIASAEDAYVPGDRSHAGVIMANALHLLPLYLDREAAAGVTATFDMRFHGGERRLLVLRDAALEVKQEGPERPDCVVLADPETFLLVGYNRIGQWRPALTGKILTWGRKPWLALKLPQLLAQI